jgi:hypothetical protein
VPPNCFLELSIGNFKRISDIQGVLEISTMTEPQARATRKAAAKKPRPASKGRLSLYPLGLENALGAAIATGPIPPEDRKPKPKKKAR